MIPARVDAGLRADTTRRGAAIAGGSTAGPYSFEVYDRYRRTQPGALSRPHRWWALRAGQPPLAPAPRYVAVHRDADGVADGYASYSRADDALTVDETIAVDDALFRAGCSPHRLHWF